jgi:hypothetical protein
MARLHGKAYATVWTIALVELDAIPVPAWAIRKAIRGLTITASSVWLRRQAAAYLVNLDEDVGGHPKVTPASFRRCGICQRALIGVEAEMRGEQDRKWMGEQVPCGPECLPAAKAKANVAPRASRAKGRAA